MPDKNSIAVYIEGLAKVTGLAALFLVSVLGKLGNFMFLVNVILMVDAFGGWYIVIGLSG